MITALVLSSRIRHKRRLEHTITWISIQFSFQCHPSKMKTTLTNTYSLLDEASDVYLHLYVTPGFKDKAECTPYVSPGKQISHIATNEGQYQIIMLNI